MAHLSPEQLQRGVIAASAGNHAQGVALSAAKLGVRAVIVMPTTTPQVKIDAVKAKVESMDTRRQLIMNSTKKIGIWMDYSKAHIMELSERPHEIAIIESKFETKLHSK
jgi:cysteine synthase